MAEDGQGGLAVLLLLFTDQMAAIFGEVGYTNPFIITTGGA